MQGTSAYLRELYAISEAVRKWHQYLLGSTFVVHTDHQSIKELLQQTVLTPEQQLFVKKLLGFDFWI